jgi:hypothetical protein
MNDLIATGWHLCPMESGSKNPGSILGANWPAKCTNDPAVIASWPQGCNIGVLLGPKSGVIDLEFDSEIGEQLIESWLEECGNPPTPTYRSAKSVHRLFQWDEKFALEKAKFGRLGVEFRFGNDTAQSVIPPSVHESGAVYQWIEGLSPNDVPVAPLPDAIYRHYLVLRASEEKQTAKAATINPRYTSGDSLLTKARNYVEQNHAWESILAADGWTFARNRGDAQDWWRPSKTRGSISGTVNFGGSKTLRVFSTSCEPLKPESSYDKFAYLCAMQFGDDPVKAAFGLCPEDVLGRKPQADVDLSRFCVDSEDPPDTAEFFEAMVPEDGLIRWVYEYYQSVSQFPSPVMGMATALSFCETIYGRRIRSQTDLRPNDYNVVMAPTGSGKEACETAIQKLFLAVGHDLMHPPDVQSGNGLLSMIHEKPCGIWVCDEFGKTLESILDKRGNNHLKQIATHLLKIYGKAATTYGGAAHSAGAKNKTVQPHLCLLGLTTPKVFSSITAEQVDDGLFGRLAFFVCQDRPKMRISPQINPPDYLVSHIQNWLEWEPMEPGNIATDPRPETLMMRADAFQRWTEHSDQIRERMDSEGEMRAGVWCRTAARSMKLAIVHRASRLRDNPSITDWESIFCELPDVNWGIMMSNFLSRTSCNLLLDDVVDMQQHQAIEKINATLRICETVEARVLHRAHPKITSAQFRAAAQILESQGVITIEKIGSGGRPKTMYRRAIQQ